MGKFIRWWGKKRKAKMPRIFYAGREMEFEKGETYFARTKRGLWRINSSEWRINIIGFKEFLTLSTVLIARLTLSRTNKEYARIIPINLISLMYNIKNKCICCIMRGMQSFKPAYAWGLSSTSGRNYNRLFHFHIWAHVNVNIILRFHEMQINNFINSMKWSACVCNAYADSCLLNWIKLFVLEF